jgi:predicted dehydrogenase
MKLKSLNLAVGGGRGHLGSVLDEMRGDADIQISACAPAYEGEDIGGVLSHPACDGAQRFGEFRQMLDAVLPDVVVVGTRLDRIAEVAKEAAQHGCHVICEKPLALSEESLERLYAAVVENRVNLTAMLSMKNMAAFRTARAAYRDGTLGEAVVLNVRKSYKWNGRPAWFGQRRLYGDTFGWVGIHAFSMIEFVTGATFTVLSAMESNQHHPEYPDCQDSGVICGVLNSGAYATISIDLFRPASAGTWGDDWLRLVGTQGTLEANASRRCCRIMTFEDKEYRDMPPEGDGMIYRAFLDGVRSGGVDASQRDEAFRLTYQCLQARLAAEKGVLIRIERKYPL